MKLTKKLRFLFSLTALLVCMCMSTVAVNADTLSDYAAETTTSADSLETYAGGKISLADAKTLVQNYVSLVQQLSTMTESEREYVEENYSSQPQTVAIIQAYNKSVDTEKYGAFVSSKDDVKVVENKDEDGTDAVDVTVTFAFEKKDYILTLHVDCFDTIGASVDTVTIKAKGEGEESLGEKMANAAGNTLMGMGTVFLVLIFISLLISCFKFIPQIMDKFTKKPSVEEKPEVVEETSETVTANEEDDSELIAVIAAAIAASEQTSTDSFVVRSIRRR